MLVACHHRTIPDATIILGHGKMVPSGGNGAVSYCVVQMRFTERLKYIALALVFGSLTAFVMVLVYAVGGGDAIIRTGRSCGFSRMHRKVSQTSSPRLASRLLR